MQLIVVTKLQNVEAPCLDTIGTAARPLAQGADIVPIPGTKRRTYLEQNCAAVNVKLSKEEIESLSRAFPLNVTAGTRYPEKQLAGLGI